MSEVTSTTESSTQTTDKETTETVTTKFSLREQMAVLRAVLDADPHIDVSEADRHIFRCPNGHYYLIGECGEASVQSKCPECGAVVGGSNHKLADNNTRIDDDALALI